MISYAMKPVLFILSVFACLSCTHTPENEVGKEKVVLVHGYGRSPAAMKAISEFLEEAGYQVYNLGYSSMIRDIEGVKKEVFRKADKFIAGSTDRVHFVGHSLGGLLVRSYLDQRKPARLGNVVIMGSPNKGTPIVEHLRDKWYFPLGGPVTSSLSSKGSSFLASLKAPTYRLGVIAGVIEREDNESMIPGKDDGLVPLESAKVAGARDTIVMNVSHYRMRFDDRVMRQMLHFLQKVSFDHSRI